MEPPTFTEVQNFTVSTDPGVSFATVSLPLPTNLMDNSGEMVSVATSRANNSQLAIGSHEITYTVTDVFGNSHTFTVVVTVIGESCHEVVKLANPVKLVWGVFERDTFSLFL